MIAKQQPIYKNKEEVKNITDEIKKYPPIVSIKEIDQLREQLLDVENGNGFLLQGGDCAESFNDFSQDKIKNFTRLMLQMTVALMHGSKLPVVKIGRIAGQYAKPRSSDMETQDGVELPSYRGDIINSSEFNLQSREPNPKRMKDAYFRSASTYNYLKLLAESGHSSLSNINTWNREFVEETGQDKLFTDLSQKISDAIDFIRACRISIDKNKDLSTMDIFISHEGLLLPYEEALIRKDGDRYYSSSAHMLWIGERTRGLTDAHVDFFKKIINPIGCKISEKISEEDLVELIRTLNPRNEKGRLVLISRMGADKIRTELPRLLKAVKREGLNVIWSCDPMHGNTFSAKSGFKTRNFDTILDEVKGFFEAHKEAGTYAGGVHFEMTGGNVTECVGGMEHISDADLTRQYETQCDPRLNASQSVELSFLIADLLSKK